MIRQLVSVIIPSRNEPYLAQTIRDLIAKHRGLLEIIVVLEGYWPPTKEIVEHPEVVYIHTTEPFGMRGAINAAVSIAKGEYLLKTDAHCMFGPEFDMILKADCADDWVVVPRRFSLIPETWEIKEKPPIDYMYLSNDLHGKPWEVRNRNKNLSGIPIDDLMSSQGSVWFMKRSYFDYLELMDEENYGTFAQEFQEVGLKAWLSGGRVVVNKKTWYAHWHKEDGRGYYLSKSEGDKAESYVKRFMSGNVWHKQKYDIPWLVAKFAPVPGWEGVA